MRTPVQPTKPTTSAPSTRIPASGARGGAFKSVAAVPVFALDIEVNPDLCGSDMCCVAPLSSDRLHGGRRRGPRLGLQLLELSDQRGRSGAGEHHPAQLMQAFAQVRLLGLAHELACEAVVAP